MSYCALPLRMPGGGDSQLRVLSMLEEQLYSKSKEFRHRWQIVAQDLNEAQREVDSQGQELEHIGNKVQNSREGLQLLRKIHDNTEELSSELQEGIKKVKVVQKENQIDLEAAQIQVKRNEAVVDEVQMEVEKLKAPIHNACVSIERLEIKIQKNGRDLEGVEERDKEPLKKPKKRQKQVESPVSVKKTSKSSHSLWSRLVTFSVGIWSWLKRQLHVY